GTAFVELAVRAGDEVGCDRVDELTLEAPLVLAAREAVLVQLRVEEPDPDGPRAFAVHSRAGQGEGWLRHATRVLAAGPAPRDTALDPTAWPPPGPPPVPPTGSCPAMLYPA
ncbi:hypothetical protein VM98_36630, partial [Streptomyces rubellomurinus subsp. indigoferus]